MKQINLNRRPGAFSSVMIFGAMISFASSLHAATPNGYAPSYGSQAVQPQAYAAPPSQMQYPTGISHQVYGSGTGPSGNYGAINAPANSAYQAPPVAPVQNPQPQSSYAPPSYVPGAAYAQPSPVVIGGEQQVQGSVSGQTSPAPAVSMAREPVIEGFADQVPLTVALQQVLPQGYGYTLGDGVNPGQLVSWRGGRSWTHVLGDMLGTTGLTYSMNDRLVMVSSMAGSPTVVGAAPTQIAPPQQMMQQMSPQMQMQQDVPLAPPPGAYQQQPMMMQPVPVAVPEPMMMVEAPPVPQGLPQPEPLQIENPPVFVPQVWDARPGQTLRQLLQDWCARAGVELNWSAEYDYPVMASVSMTGTFEEAVRVLLSGFDGANPVPRARLHYNPAAGQSILIVEATGNHYGD